MSKKLYILFIFIFLTFTINAKELKPTLIYEATGGVTDIIFNNNKIFVSTNKSSVDIFDLNSTKVVKSITVPKIKDFMGDVIDSKIYNIDVYKESILLTSQASKGFREIHIFKNNKLEKIIGIDSKMFISKAKFIDSHTILFTLLGNEMYLYDIDGKKILWKIDVRPDDAVFNSTFSDFALNEDRTMVVVADESGDLKIVDIKKAKVVKVLADKNLDKVFKVDYKNNKIITAGQDGRCVIYDMTTDKDYFLREKKWFLIYGAGLSPSGKFGAFSSDENNNVTVFDTDTKSKLFKLTQNVMTLSSILFIEEDKIFVTTDSNKFNYYKLKN